MSKLILTNDFLLIKMKCTQCGFENKENAKFCTKCGASLVQENAPPATPEPKKSDSKYIIIALLVIIVLLVAVIGFFAFNQNSAPANSNNAAQSESSKVNQSDDSASGNAQTSSSESSTQTTSSTPAKSKSWELIGSYSGSGSGSQTVTVPAGQIMVKLSAYPIKNYATNHLYVTGSSASGGVDWGPTSDVEIRSDSFEYTSSSSQTFNINYYETVNWEVEFYRYQ